MKIPYATCEQPKPMGGGPIILNHVRNFIGEAMGRRQEYDEHLGQVADDLVLRSKMGEARYGTPLRAGNGRDPDVDLYQELLDAVMYAGQSKLQHGAGDWMLGPLLRLAKELREALDRRDAADR